MRQIIASAFVSLDGVMQAHGLPDEDRSGGFRFGGWTAPYWDDAIAETMTELFSAPFDLLLGRCTYDIFAGYWPQITDEADPFSADIARVFNQATKYVATHHGETLAWENSQWLGRDIIARLRELKRTGAGAAGAGQQHADATAAGQRSGGRTAPAHLPGAARRRQAAVR